MRSYWNAVSSYSCTWRELHETKWFASRGLDDVDDRNTCAVTELRYLIDKRDIYQAEGVLKKFGSLCYLGGGDRDDFVDESSIEVGSACGGSLRKPRYKFWCVRQGPRSVCRIDPLWSARDVSSVCVKPTGESEMAFVRRTRADLDVDKLMAEYHARPAPTEEQIEAWAVEDGDAWTDEDFARARVVYPPPTADEVRALRAGLVLSQAQFADRFG